MASKRQRHKAEQNGEPPEEQAPPGAEIVVDFAGEGKTLVVLPNDPRQNRKKYPLWDIGELQRDIERAEKNIETYETAILEQRDTIFERRGQIRQCRERDQAIKQYERDVAALKEEYGSHEIEKALRERDGR
jgi:hypothetical protein